MASTPPNSSPPLPHFVIFPFMSKGHTIPLLHLSRLLLLRGASVTVFTTSGNRPFISSNLPSAASLIVLPFPSSPDIPPGIESTDKLPSISLFIPFVNSTRLLLPSFHSALSSLNPNPTCLISDGFLPWTLHSATLLRIPRLTFTGMSHHATVLSLISAPLLSLHSSPDQVFPVPGFPSITLCRNDFDRPFTDQFPTGPHWDFILEAGRAMAASFGMIVNSFYNMEKPFADHSAAREGLRCYTVGPLCLAGPPVGPRGPQKPRWIEWLDEKNQTPVLYVAFGSQAEISAAQLREIANGLESSNARFLWVVRKDFCDLNVIGGSFEERVKGKGIIVNEWVDQREILEHPAVQGFLSHCGWNSVLEGICAEVPILAWPMMAEQYLNAKFVTEEIGIGLRVGTVDGTRKGFVAGENLRSAVVELMEGEKGKRVREKVKEVAKEARKAVAEGGSSWLDLNRMIEETSKHAKMMNSYVE